MDWRESDNLMHEHVEGICLTACRGDLDAVRFCSHLTYVAHLWDDLIDGDKTRTPQEINSAMTMALGLIPVNPFFQRHIKELAPLMLSAALTWQNSNALGQGSQDERFAGFMVRQGLGLILHHCLYLVGGYEWAIEHGPAFWSMLHVNMTANFEEYKQEMEAECQPS